MTYLQTTTKTTNRVEIAQPSRNLSSGVQYTEAEHHPPTTKVPSKAILAGLVGFGLVGSDVQGAVRTKDGRWNAVRAF